MVSAQLLLKISLEGYVLAYNGPIDLQIFIKNCRKNTAELANEFMIIQYVKEKHEA